MGGSKPRYGSFNAGVHSPGGGKSSTDGGDKSALGQEIPRGYQLHTPLHQTSSMADKYLFHTHKISSISLIRFTRVVTHS